jgi:uncharacterized protein
MVNDMRMIKRTYEALLEEHFAENRQMLFLVGPRQVGKTTTSLEVSEPYKHHFYFNWDAQEDRIKIVAGPDAIAEVTQLHTLRKTLPLIVFDELHKYGKWKTFLKGFFDKYWKYAHIIVTGSARLNVYKAGGDSLMGRYFSYRLHPLSIAELVDPKLKKTEISAPKKVSDELFFNLLAFGGFPEPFLKRTPQFYTRWNRSRAQQLFEEDLRDLTRIQELGQMQLLAEVIRQQVGQLTSYTELAKKVNVSIDTIRRWLEILKSFYFCYTLQPWSKNIVRSLLKEPKIYLWDWSCIADIGARAENFIASHLLKAVHFWTDRGWGEYDLYYLRDKEKREVDFLVAKNGKPWFLVEVKHSSNGSPSKALFYFQKMLNAEFALQVALDMDYVDRSCFDSARPLIVPAKTFLSQLV